VPLLEAIESGRLRIAPEARCNEVVAFIRSGLEDISVSRSTERARGWGTAVPDDPGQVIYVWYDALGNYITALGYGTNQTAYRSWWRESDQRVHVIGKGILRFHAVYWPAFLLSAGEPLPTAIYVHDYLTIDGAKISKSSGNIIDPSDLVNTYGVDALRWWVTSDVARSGDTNFTRQRLVDRANQDLANGYGNLVNRIGALIDKYRPEGCPPAPARDPLLDQAAKTRIDVHEALDRFDIRAAALAVSDLIRAANAYIQHHRPWEQAKADPASRSSRQDFDHTIGCLNSVVLTIAELLQIFTPDLAGKAIARIEGTTSDVLFPRLEHKPSDGTSHRTDCSVTQEAKVC
jgi:methionyl-tRNA synthetase